MDSPVFFPLCIVVAVLIYQVFKYLPDDITKIRIKLVTRDLRRFTKDTTLNSTVFQKLARRCVALVTQTIDAHERGDVQ